MVMLHVLVLANLLPVLDPLLALSVRGCLA